MPTLKSKGIVSVFRARINRFDEDFGLLTFHSLFIFRAKKGVYGSAYGKSGPKIERRRDRSFCVHAGCRLFGGNGSGPESVFGCGLCAFRAARGGRLVHERAAVYVQDVPSNERGLRRAQEPRALGHFLRRPETVQGHFLSDNRP